ncbi:hypothetical protein ACQCX2_10060 [Propionibacteriaceae bacterium Y1700]|uniref:HNH endonuclease signature motif containing protein n=1 Tax=Microlunatus sp. Y1700 TaxID=3418487 RepID=UPI003DA782C0
MMTATNVDLDPVDVLRSVADCSHARTRAEADLFAAAVAWADLNPTTPDNPFAVQWWDGERVDDGEPEVAASAVAEFAATAGLSQYAGKSLMHEALLLRQRMPRTWLLVQQCRIPAFRAQQLVATALHLGASALGWLDEQTAAVNGRIGRASIDRMVARAEAMFGQASDVGRAAPYVRIDHGVPGHLGTARLDGHLEIPDAVDLEAALQACAEDRQADGSSDDRDARRAMALGDLARHWLGQDVLPSPQVDDVRRQPAPRVTRAREVTLYVHLSAAATAGECGTTRSVVTVDQVRDWCGRPGTTVIIKPVIDLNQDHERAGHDPSRYREQTALRDWTCVFPFCERPAHPVAVRRNSDGSLRESTDLDHIVPWRPGDLTSTDGLAHLCRRHHRLKTHDGWRYRSVAPGWYLWVSPHRFQFLRTPSGTTQLSEPVGRQLPDTGAGP